MIFNGKKIISILLVSLCSAIARAQNSHEGDAKNFLLNNKKDTSQVNLLEDLSFSYLTSKPDTALLLAEKALSISKDIGYEKGEASSLNRIGTVLNSTGNYPHALENFLQALQINEDIDNKDGIMRNLGNIGNVYANQGDYREALNYSFREKAIAENVNDKELLAITLVSIGDTYEKMNQLDSARIYTNRAHELALSVKNGGLTGIALNNLGNIYAKMGQGIIAMEFYKQSLAYYEKDNDDEGICETTLGMAKVFQKKGLADSALYYAKRSVTTAQESGFTIYLLNGSRFLTNFYKTKNIDSAFRYQEISIAANDSLFDEEKIRQVHSLAFSEKIREQEKEKEKKRLEEERRNNVQLMGIATVIVTFFLILLLLRKRKTPARTVEVLGLIGLLLLFEFIALLIHPIIANITNHRPILMMLILIAIATLLVPAHHFLEKMIKVKLAYKIDYETKPSRKNPEKYRS